MQLADIELMMAQKTQLDEVDGFPWLLQPKLNGIRAVWNPDTQALETRSGRIITGLPHIIEALRSRNLACYALDGEIYTPDLPFQEINGLAARKTAIEASYLLEFHCFDIVNTELTAMERIALVKEMHETPCIRIVPTYVVHSRVEAAFLFDSYREAGYEGIVLRDPDALYNTRGQRGDWMLKIKPVHEIETRLVGFKPAAIGSKNEDTFGSLILELETGKRFRCSGLSDLDRHILWKTRPIGQMVTVSYGELSKTGIPVFPRYKGLRWDIEEERTGVTIVVCSSKAKNKLTLGGSIELKEREKGPGGVWWLFSNQQQEQGRAATVYIPGDLKPMSDTPDRVKTREVNGALSAKNVPRDIEQNQRRNDIEEVRKVWNEKHGVM